MTKRELVELYLHRKGLAVTSGDKDSLVPIIPFFIVAIAREVLKPHIDPENYTQKKKVVAGDIGKELGNFQRDFQDCFAKDAELSIAMGEMMCDFEDYIAHDVNIFKMQILGFMMDFDTKEKIVLTDLFLAESLIKAAQTLWELVYRKGSASLAMLLNALPKFEGMIKTKGIAYTPIEQGDLDNAVNILSRKIIKFLTI